MGNLLIALFVVFCLMFAPVAHAAGVDGDDGCQTSLKVDKHSQNDEQDEGKPASGMAHCCCSHNITIRDSINNSDIIKETPLALIVVRQINMASITVGPLLEPPSHV